MRVKGRTVSFRPNNQADITGDLSLDHSQERIVKTLVGMLRDSRLQNDEFETLGEVLWNVLLKNNVGKALMKAVDDAGTQRLVRVELVFEPTDSAKNEDLEFSTKLTSWPWEWLFCPRDPTSARGGYFLADKADRLMLTRVLLLADEPRNLTVEKEPLRVLFVGSSPQFRDSTKKERLTPVQFENFYDWLWDRDRARKASSSGDAGNDTSGGLIDLRSVRTEYRDPDLPPPEDPSSLKDAHGEPIVAATYRHFLGAVETFFPHVIHIVGHGQCVESGGRRGGQIAFANADGTARWVGDQELADDLQHSTETRLVFMQACESALPDPYQAISGVALQLAHRNIPAVIGMQYRVKNAVANRFAHAFYESLANYDPIDVAVQKGRRAIADDAEDADDAEGATGDSGRARVFGLPVLYMRESAALWPARATPKTVRTAPAASHAMSPASTSASGTIRPATEEDKLDNAAPATPPGGVPGS